MSSLPETIGPVDRRVGAAVRARRELLGLSVEALAAKLGCPPCTLLDYEAGAARIGAAAMLSVTQALGVDVAYLLRGLSRGAAPPPYVTDRRGDKPAA
jgi:transcriptional regulator with XRE-family HTH domain